MIQKTTLAVLLALTPALVCAQTEAQKKEQADKAKAEAAAKAEGKEAKADIKLYLKLKKGGEAMFKKGAKKGNAKLKFGGFSKKKAAEYDKAAEKDSLDKKLYDELAAADKAKAKEIASDAQYNKDLEGTIRDSLEKAKEADEKERLEAAREMLPKMKGDTAAKAEKFNKDHGGKTIIIIIIE